MRKKMVHKKLPPKVKSSVQRMSHAQLFNLLVFILALVSKRGRLTKAQRKSLAITEGALGIRKKVVSEKGELKGKKHKGRGKHKKKTKKKRHMSAKQRANAMRFKRFVKRHGRGPHKGEKLSD